MATLNANSLQLRQIERRRQLAEALQKQAMSFEPIQHPYQGLAKLAQAWVGARMNRRSDEEVEEIKKAEQEALAKALGPQYAYSTELTGMGGTAQPVGQGGTVPSVFNQMQTSPGLPQRQIDQLMALDPQARNTVLGNYVQSQLIPDTDDAGLEAGFFGVYSPPGQEPQEMRMYLDERTNRVVGVQSDGKTIGLDSRYISEPTKRTQEVPVSTRAKYAEQFAAAQSTLGEINRLGEYVSQGGLAEESGLGSAFSLAESVRSAFSGLYDRFEILVGGKPVRDSGQLAKRQTFVGYGMDSVTDRDRSKYSDATIAGNISAWEELQKLDAATQQLSISIAYSLARIADPGGRLSEMDVLNQIRSLGLQQASVPRRLAALTEARITFADQVYNRYSNLKAAGVEVGMDPTLMSDIMAIREGTYPGFGGGSTGQNQQQRYENYMRQWGPQVIALRASAAGLTPQQRRQLERQNNMPEGILD